MDAKLLQSLSRTGRRALIAGAIAAALGIAWGLADRAQFFRSYLLAFLFWQNIALGCLAILLLHHLTGGAWGYIIRRGLEAGARTLPWMGIAFLPLYFGLGDLYPWARPAEVEGSELLQHKSAYLNVPFFLMRAAFYFAVWTALAHLLTRWSLEQDRTGDPAVFRRLQMLGAAGLLLYGLTATFSSIDWAMSLEPEWFSTIYGALFMVGQALAALALMIAVTARLAARPPLSEAVTPSRLQDLGSLLLAFVMLWAYIAFSQYLITWSGNLPEEIPWYLNRLHGGWEWIGLALVVFHFALPFFLLLSRGVKRRAKFLVGVAGVILFLRLVDLFWLTAPAFREQGLGAHTLDLILPAALGGLWVAVFIRELRGKPLLPLHDPRMEEAAAEATGGLNHEQA